ncbi:hypothetical protein [uncultured Mediterranean phage uvMED]|nr:hypothetical protein [uncultured Mediterranean phage uvMED]
MAIKKKTKAQKDQDVQHLEKMQLKLFNAARNLEREVWELQFDLSWIRLKDLTDLFNSIRKVNYALERVQAKNIYSDWNDIKDKDDRENYTTTNSYE